MERNAHRIILLVCVVILSVIGGRISARVEAQSKLLPPAHLEAHDQVKSFPPYLLFELPDGSKVYKAMDQGCELFIAERYHHEMKYGSTVAVSITTGRGCK